MIELKELKMLKLFLRDEFKSLATENIWIEMRKRKKERDIHHHFSEFEKIEYELYKENFTTFRAGKMFLSLYSTSLYKSTKEHAWNDRYIKLATDLLLNFRDQFQSVARVYIYLHSKISGDSRELKYLQRLIDISSIVLASNLTFLQIYGTALSSFFTIQTPINLYHFENLTELRLIKCFNFYDREILHSIKYPPNLQNLNLVKNHINEFYFHDGNALPKSIRKLLLAKNKLTSISLPEVLEYFPNLIDLNLSYCGKFKIDYGDDEAYSNYSNRKFAIGVLGLPQFFARRIQFRSIYHGFSVYLEEYGDKFMTETEFVHRSVSKFVGPGIYTE